jgi:hypothetical protein
MRSLRLLLAAFLFTAAPAAFAEPAKTPAALTFLRTADTDTKARALQTATIEYKPTSGSGPNVLLVGVAHLGTKEYFQALQKRLDAATVVLYEGVGLKDVKKGPGAVSDGAGVQDTLAKALGLEFQLNVIDYRRPHFINSDLHVPELQEEVRKRSDPATGAGGAPQSDAMMDQLMEALQGTGLTGGSLNQMIGLLGATPQMREMTKSLLVETLSQAGELLEMAKTLSPEMKDLFDVLLTQRNAIVLGDLRAQIGKLKAGETVAVFYGAAHMDEIAKSLRDDLGYVPAATHWDSAFSANPEQSGINPAQIKMMIDMMRLQFQPPQAK